MTTPTPYVITPPVKVVTFESATGWTLFESGGSGGALVDGTAGFGGLRIQHNGSAGSHYTRADRRDFTLDLTGTSSPDDLIHLKLGFEDAPRGPELQKGTAVRVYFGEGFTNGSWFSSYWNLDDNSYRRPKDVITVKKSDFSTIAGAGVDWSDIDTVAVYIRANFGPPTFPDHDFTGDCTVDEIWLGGESEKIITLSLDDGDDEQHTIMLDDLEANGWACSLNINGGRLGTAGVMSEANALARMVLHLPTNHTHDHDDLNDGEATYQADFLEQHQYLLSKGFQQQFGSWTSGTVNEAMALYLRDTLGYKAARGANIGPSNIGARGETVLFPWGESGDIAHRGWDCPVINLSSTGTYNTAAAVDAAITKCHAYGQVARVYGHGIGTGDSRLFPQAEWDTLMTNLATHESGGAKIIRDDEFMLAMSGAGSRAMMPLTFRHFGRRKSRAGLRF